MNWIKQALSEPDGSPSSQRCFLLILLIFTLNLIACAFYKEGHLPDVPASLADMIKWMFGFVVAGIGVGKVAAAVSGPKSDGQL